jgi:hypothetical protein
MTGRRQKAAVWPTRPECESDLNQRLRIGLREQRLCADEIVGLSWREYELDRIARLARPTFDLFASIQRIVDTGRIPASGHEG